MNSSIEVVKLEMVAAQRTAGNVDIIDWVGRYPQFREELLEFWSWLVGTDDGTAAPETAEASVALSPEDLASYTDAVRDACLAVSFGREMILREGPPELERLGADLEYARRGRPAPTPKFKDFSRAVVYTWIVRSLAEKRPRVSRLASQKVSYLLECSLELGLFDGHRRNQLGPYDSAAKYRDAEPIAKKKGWLRVEGATLSVTEKASAIDTYCKRYLRSADAAARLMTVLADVDDPKLEVLATVLPIAREIHQAGREVSVEAVRAAIGETAEWRGKLGRAHFAPERVDEALVTLRALRLVGA